MDNTRPVPGPKGATRLTTVSKGRQPVFLRHIVVTIFFNKQKKGWKQPATGGSGLKACFQLSRNRACIQVDPNYLYPPDPFFSRKLIHVMRGRGFGRVVWKCLMTSGFT